MIRGFWFSQSFAQQHYLPSIIPMRASGWHNKSSTLRCRVESNPNKSPLSTNSFIAALPNKMLTCPRCTQECVGNIFTRTRSCPPGLLRHSRATKIVLIAAICERLRKCPSFTKGTFTSPRSVTTVFMLFIDWEQIAEY